MHHDARVISPNAGIDRPHNDILSQKRRSLGHELSLVRCTTHRRPDSSLSSWLFPESTEARRAFCETPKKDREDFL